MSRVTQLYVTNWLVFDNGLGGAIEILFQN